MIIAFWFFMCSCSNGNALFVHCKIICVRKHEKPVKSPWSLALTIFVLTVWMRRNCPLVSAQRMQTALLIICSTKICFDQNIFNQIIFLIIHSIRDHKQGFTFSHVYIKPFFICVCSKLESARVS